MTPRLAPESLTDRQALPYAVVALCVPLVFLQLAETAIQPYFLWAGGVRTATGLLSVGAGLGVALGLGSGWRRGAILAFLSLFATLHVIGNYRGAYVWPGTLDFFDLDRGRWLNGVAWSVPIGAAIGAALFRGRERPLPSGIAYAAIAAMLASAVVVWLQTSVGHAESISEYAPTRPWAYTFAGVLCLAFMIQSRKEEA